MRLRFVIPKGWHRLRVGTEVKAGDRYPDGDERAWLTVFDWVGGRDDSEPAVGEHVGPARWDIVIRRDNR
jgi:hypothetical protein